jgi:hypothetical protein
MKLKPLEIALWVAFFAAAGYAVYTFLPKPQEESLPEYTPPVTPTPDPALSKWTGVLPDVPPPSKDFSTLEPIGKGVVEV